MRWLGRRQQADKKSTRELEGHSIDIVKEGIDEAQVVDFVNTLVGQSGGDGSTQALAPSEDKEDPAEPDQADTQPDLSMLQSEEIATLEKVAEIDITNNNQEASSVSEVEVAPLQLPDSLSSEDVQKIERTEEKTPMEISQQYNVNLYTGEVELVLNSPAGLKLMSRLYNCLQTIPELKILHSEGSANRGIMVTVVLEKPLALIGLLSTKLPGVIPVPELPGQNRTTEGALDTTVGREKKGNRRIRLIPE